MIGPALIGGSVLPGVQYAGRVRTAKLHLLAYSHLSRHGGEEQGMQARNKADLVLAVYRFLDPFAFSC
jgi:hypothetical protein